MNMQDEPNVKIRCVQVQLITGYNNDRHDLAAGGDAILGPYMWVVESHKDDFVAEMKKRYGKNSRVRKIEVTDAGFYTYNKLPTVEEEILEFEKYLANSANW